MKQFLLPFLIVAALTLTTFGESPVALQPNDNMQSVLVRQVGQIVDLRMKSGEKLGGKLEKVTEKLVHLTQLTGAEFYEAVVEIDDISAVAVRTKTQ